MECRGGGELDELRPHPNPSPKERELEDKSEDYLEKIIKNIL